jgi:hypothetical protein
MGGVTAVRAQPSPPTMPFAGAPAEARPFVISARGYQDTREKRAPAGSVDVTPVVTPRPFRLGAISARASALPRLSW